MSGWGKAWGSPQSSGVHQEGRSVMGESTEVGEDSPDIEGWVGGCQVKGWS